jgi:hypothetical protein
MPELGPNHGSGSPWLLMAEPFSLSLAALSEKLIAVWLLSQKEEEKKRDLKFIALGRNVILSQLLTGGATH